MKNLNVCLLAAVACTYSLQATANLREHNSNFLIGNEFSLPNLSVLSNKVITLELESLTSSNHGIKLAAVCDLGNGNCNGLGDSGFDNVDNDIDFDNNTQCRDAGYNFTSCPTNQTLEDACPFDSKYFKSCKCPEEFKYTASSCAVQFSNSTLGSELCISEGTTYSNSCVCNTGTYPFTTSSCTGNESLSGTICKASNGISYSSKCVCTPTSGACSGYNLDSDTCSGGSKIGESCHNGCQLKWKCKDLCPYKGTLTSCPNGYICTLEECSNKLYVSGCHVGDVDIEKCSWYSCWINTFTK